MRGGGQAHVEHPCRGPEILEGIVGDVGTVLRGRTLVEIPHVAGSAGLGSEGDIQRVAPFRGLGIDLGHDLGIDGDDGLCRIAAGMQRSGDQLYIIVGHLSRRIRIVKAMGHILVGGGGLVVEVPQEAHRIGRGGIGEVHLDISAGRQGIAHELGRGPLVGDGHHVGSLTPAVVGDRIGQGIIPLDDGLEFHHLLIDHIQGTHGTAPLVDHVVPRAAGRSSVQFQQLSAADQRVVGELGS